MVEGHYTARCMEGTCYQCGEDIIYLNDDSKGGTNICNRCRRKNRRLDLLTITLNRYYALDEIWPDDFLTSLLELCKIDTDKSSHISNTLREDKNIRYSYISGPTNTGFSYKQLDPIFKKYSRDDMLSHAVCGNYIPKIEYTKQSHGDTTKIRSVPDSEHIKLSRHNFSGLSSSTLYTADRSRKG